MFINNFKYSFKILIRNKGLIFWTFAFPILLGLFFYLAFSDIENKEKKVLDIFYNLLGGLKYVVGLIVAIHLFTRYLCDNNYMNEIQKMHKLINEMSMGEFINYLGVKEMSLDDIGDPVVKFMKDVYVTSKNNIKCL